jgi:hypothetical protein
VISNNQAPRDALEKAVVVLLDVRRLSGLMDEVEKTVLSVRLIALARELDADLADGPTFQ